MLTFTDIQSTPKKIEMQIEINEVEFDLNLPRIDEIEPIKLSINRLFANLNAIDEIALNAEVSDDEYHKLKKDNMVFVEKIMEEVKEEFCRTNKRFGQFMIEGRIISFFSEKVETQMSLLRQDRFEKEAIQSIKSLFVTFYKEFQDQAEKRADEYGKLNKLVQKPVNGVIVFEDDKSFSFHVTKFGYAYPQEMNTQVANWKELMDKVIHKELEKMVLQSMDIRDEFVQRFKKFFSPIQNYEDVLTVGEFQFGRGEVMNFWAERFSFTGGFNFHFFKALGFFEKFESEFIGRLNETNNRVKAMIAKYRQVDPNISIEQLYVANLGSFLKGKRALADASIDAKSDLKYHYINNLDERKILPFIKLSTNNFAKMFRGSALSDRVIVRPSNKAGLYRNEVIVVTMANDKNDPKSYLIDHRFENLHLVKSEDYSDRIVAEGGGVCFDADYKFSYYLTTTDMRKVA